MRIKIRRREVRCVARRTPRCSPCGALLATEAQAFWQAAESPGERDAAVAALTEQVLAWRATPVACPGRCPDGQVAAS